MNIGKYLIRINFKGKIQSDLETLRLLQKAHLYNIPFENLDIHYNTAIKLESPYVLNKILNSNRGGYCYELNGIFCFLLRALGFNAIMVSARVSDGKGGWGEEFDHLTIVVKLNDLWLSDVGFGDSFIEPLKIELDTVQKDLNGFYKIVSHEEEYLKLMKSENGSDYSDEYIFKLTDRKWDEFNGMNNYHQTSHESHFTKKRICSIATKNGRISLSDDKLTITENKNKTIMEISNEIEFKEKLLEYFFIDMNT